MDWVVQKASELGVKAVLPLISRHGVVRPQPESGGQVARWQRIATEAAQQSEQWQPPQVLEPIGSSPLFLRPSSHHSTSISGAAGTPWDWPTFPPALPTDTITLIVGPEGGWAEELSQAVDGRCPGRKSG